MTTQQKQQALNNSLSHFGFPKEFYIETKDSKFAIATKKETEYGWYEYTIHTIWMKYEEMNGFIMGYAQAITKSIF
jgi:hypothetical protein